MQVKFCASCSRVYVWSVQRAVDVEHLSLRELCEGTWRGGGSFTGDPGGCVKEGSGDRHLSPEGLRWGTCKGAQILGTLKYE